MIWQKLKALFGGEAKTSEVFQEEWIALLEKNVPLYARLPEELRLRLHERIGHFIAAQCTARPRRDHAENGTIRYSLAGEGQHGTSRRNRPRRQQDRDHRA